MTVEKESNLQYYERRMLEFTKMASGQKVNYARVVGESPAKIHQKAFVAIFNDPETRKSRSFFASLPPHFNYSHYRSKIMEMSPIAPGKASADAFIDEVFARDNEKFFDDNDYPAMLLVFGIDAKTRKQTVDFYYPAGTTAFKGLLRFRIAMRREVSLRN